MITITGPRLAISQLLAVYRLRYGWRLQVVGWAWCGDEMRIYVRA